MNIFAISDDEQDCAQALDDRRLVKMVLETAQLLSGAARARPDLAPGAEIDALYRATHPHHPVSLWVRADGAHFHWTRRLLAALLDEYRHRFDRDHACGRIHLALGPAGPGDAPGQWCNCTPFPDLPVFDAYRATLEGKWRTDIRPPTWRRRGPPSWWSAG
jgi:hypothetical protein